jgi:cytidine deaminase
MTLSGRTPDHAALGAATLARICRDPRVQLATLSTVVELFLTPLSRPSSHHGKLTSMDQKSLAATVDACRSLIATRFPVGASRGAAAMLLDDGTVLTGTSPDNVNSSVDVCHEIEPYCAAFRLGRRVVASVCLHRLENGEHRVLSPCGVCRERLANHGADVLVAVPGSTPTEVTWVTLREALPHYWLNVFPEDSPWTT